MFTGIVSAVGRVTKATQNGGLALVIRAPFKGVKRGESIAVNGACLTVERVAKGAFTVHVIDTTRDRTLLGEYAAGRPVNLLTVNALPPRPLVQVSLIPFTRAHTTLGGLRVGDQVHVEGDVLGKYVRQLCRSER